MKMVWGTFVAFVFVGGFGSITPAAPAPAPTLLAPAAGATNVDPDTSLNWRWADEMLTNGSFESGLSSGWSTGGSNPQIWTLHTETANPYGMGCRWAATIMPSTPQQVTAQLIQTFLIPADATSVTLQWAERISNRMPYTFPSIGLLTVSLYDEGTPLKTLHSAYGGEARYLSNIWVACTADLLAYAGQQPQLVVEATGSPNNASKWKAEVDGFKISCECVWSVPEFQLYLGKTATLGPTNLVAVTTALNYPIPPLDPCTTYYWQVGAVRDASTNLSSTAHFTTGQRVPPAVTVAAITDNGLRLSFPTRTNRCYAIEQREQLDDSIGWYEILNLGAGSGGQITVDVPYPGIDAAYWRLRVTTQ